MRSISISVAVLLMTIPAAAAVYGGSNFGSFTYPDHRCGAAPILPQRPSDMTSVRAVEAYNREVDAYNSRLQVYGECVNQYVENARNDVERIRQKAAEASATLETNRQLPR